ncbi:ssp2p [Saccharomyces arboricola H-6]|uniref:Ssp2p n=1 Tax=Saccharomyces arboricola (strain H-6 / AS 2.3317 / CBS 10644) TaxID=1160507 RepID=J8LHT2_SACAR|nr:ssp2p [Saccharomyces arboricola H-6]
MHKNYCSNTEIYTRNKDSGDIRKRVLKSRKPSFFSFFNDTSSSNGNELLGFRRFAKAYLFGEEIGSCGTDSYTPVKANLNKRRTKKEDKNDQPLWKRQHYSQGCSFFIDDDSDKKTETAAKNFHENYNHIDNSLISRGAQFLDETKFVDEKVAGSQNSAFLKARSVSINDIPHGTGIASVLSQVRGGSLERIVVYRYDTPERSLHKVDLFFLNYDGAQAFMRYATTNIFKVNGVHLKPEWIFLESTYENVMKEQSVNRILDEDKLISRCLIVKKSSTKTILNKSNQDKAQKLENIDIQELEKDFQNFGEVLEITPIVSRKLCVSIFFYDISSAMRAIEEYEQKGSYLNNKYFKAWTIWYGKDITDQPCIDL